MSQLLEYDTRGGFLTHRFVAGLLQNLVVKFFEHTATAWQDLARPAHMQGLLCSTRRLLHDQ